MTQAIKLSEAQKRIIRQMQEYGYLLAWSRSYQFWEFKKGEKSISYNVSTRTAQSLVNLGLLEIEGANVENQISVGIQYKLSKKGKSIEL